MKNLTYLLTITCLFVASCTETTTHTGSKKKVAFDFSTDSLRLVMDQQGMVTELTDRQNQTGYLPLNETAPLMQVCVDNKLLVPQCAGFDADSQAIALQYENDIEASIRVLSQGTHLTFELVSLTQADTVELVVWGPYPTTIGETIGATVGVVRGTGYAIGIQALNLKTLGGYPWQEDDCMPNNRVQAAARPTDFGSTLQAYCRNRLDARVIENWNHDRYVAPAFDDGGLVGSKIALFGCPVEQTLQTLGAIELAEDLPHPMIDGQWGKTARSASAAYLIMGFGENNIDRALDVTKKAGLRYLYHPGPFETWGHFKLKEGSFPDGPASMKRCVEKAKTQDVMLGLHTLSNFITPNDPYVTPVPDARLARVGTSQLSVDVDDEQTEIPIVSPDFFNQFKNNHLKAVVVGDELIRYGGVSEAMPWMLLDCQRGAFGTRAASHKKDTDIAKLVDHAYKVFLTNTELSIEMAQNIAELYNQTGLRQISFDGLEGNRSTGMGEYGEILFTQAWYNHLSDNIKQHYIADASRTSHYFWHMYTRMNWGEPWYAGFRESQTDYRLKNQAYFQANLMPGMLGWFNMTPQTSLEDIEWMLTRSAAFNAGYAFCTSYATLDRNAQADEILRLIGQWEKARLSNAFTEDQKDRMKDIKTEFSLEAINENEWNLTEIFSHKFKHAQKVRQPGEPLYSTFAFKNPASKQTMQFLLTAAKGNVQDIKMEIDNYKQVSLPVTLSEGETLKYTGGDIGVIYSENWAKLKEINMDPSVVTLASGEHALTFDCSFSGDKESLAKLEVRFVGPVERIKAK